jgi:hypothetical protein
MLDNFIKVGETTGDVIIGTGEAIFSVPKGVYDFAM